MKNFLTHALIRIKDKSYITMLIIVAPMLNFLSGGNFTSLQGQVYQNNKDKNKALDLVLFYLRQCFFLAPQSVQCQ